MRSIPIRFTSGINRRSGAPITSPYNMEDCYINPYDEVKAWEKGSADHGLTDKWIPRGKPWLKFNGRWFDSDMHDSSMLFQNRAFLSQIDDTTDAAEIYTSQLIRGTTPVDDFYQQRFSRRLQDISLVYGSYGLFNRANKISIQYGNIFGQVRSWDAADTGIQGITVGRAVDYVFVPIDRYGQAGPWEFATILMDVDTAGATNITGTAVYTVVPEFNFAFALSSFWQDDDTYSEFGYEKVAVYRTVEYDLDGVTVDPTSTVSQFSPGGYYLEGINSDGNYLSESYWPFDINKDASTLTDQLGPVIDRSRNHWINRLNANKNNLAARAAHMDRGVGIYGNVAYPTKFPQAAMWQQRAEANITATFAAGPDTITRSAGSYITDGFDVGDDVWLYGATNATNNGKHIITSLTATVMTVTGGIVSEGPTSDVTIFNAPKTVATYTYVKPDNTTVINNTGRASYNLPRVEYDAYKMVIPYNGSETGVRIYTKYTPDIVSISDTGDTITIRGDWSDFFARSFASGDQITVTGTASNDGVFDIAGTTTAVNVTPETAGELSIDADAKTFTRTTGSFVTDGYTVGMNIAFAAFSPNLGYYTVNTVTATTLTVDEAPRATQVFTEGVPWAMGGLTISTSGGNTVLPVTQDITVAEGAVGNVEFYIQWEDVALDSNGRYVSRKQVPGEYYTFSGHLDNAYDFFSPGNYENPQVLAAVPAGVNVIQEPSRFYMSEVNAPWEITLNSGITPDDGEIVDITPSRIEESEQLTSYEFYIFTENAVYVAQRSGFDVALTTVESTVGCARGINNQPLTEVVKGGVVFYGTDDNLYYVSGRQVQKIGYDIFDLLEFGVDDMTYDAKNDYLFVKVSTNDGIYVYDFDRKMWIGNQRNSTSFDDTEYQVAFEGSIDSATMMVGDQIGDSVFGNYQVIDQNDFEFYSEIAPSAGLRVVLKIDRVSPPSTVTVAVLEQPPLSTPGDAWTVISGDILSGDIDWDGGGEELYLEIDTLPAFIVDGGVDFRFRVRGIHDNPAVPSSATLAVRNIGYDKDSNNIVSSFTSSGDIDKIIFEEQDGSSGYLRFSPELYTQEMDQIATQSVKELRLSFDGQLFGQTGATWTAGTNQFTEGTGDDINVGLDVGGIIQLISAGIAEDGSVCDLISVITNESAGTVTIADTIRRASGGSIGWRRPCDLRLEYLDSGTFRNKTTSWRPLLPNRPYFPKGGNYHRMRLGMRDFDTIRELLIFVEESLDED